MDWSTVATSILGSSAIMSAIAFILKKSFMRALDLKFENLKEIQKARIKEEIRRNAKLFDSQFDVMRTALSLVYRARNTARELLKQYDLCKGETTLDVRRNQDAFVTYAQAIKTLLYDEKAILPKNVIEIIHDLKNSLAAVKVKLILLDSNKTAKNRNHTIQELRTKYEHIDRGYEMLTAEIQGILKVSEVPYD
ncbi:MAG: hypothetical protein GY797_22150 [Deltaproteobacteria bacterium]|nr:hypothetical protein [Deltaproteobacteria bacterium]